MEYWDILQHDGLLKHYVEWKKPEISRKGKSIETESIFVVARPWSCEQRMTWLDSITDSMDTKLSKLWEKVEDRGAWHAMAYGAAESDMT